MTWGIEALTTGELAYFFGRAFFFAVGGYIGGFWLLSMKRMVSDAF